jgi:molecular chaperone HtpG
MNATNKKTTTASYTMDFGADVSRLLNIVANALYTDHDVFLRELISNAADACDRLRYEAIAKPELAADNPNFRIHIYKDTDARTLTIVDNGIGMSRAELIDHLGTIAKSGTAKIMEKVSKSKDADPLKLIGQFGVGFYASYMVSDTVRVVSKKAGGKSVHTWESDGASGFDVRKATKDEETLLDGARGTAIVLNIKDSASEFLLDEKIKQTVEQYSDHINVKIFLNTPEETKKGESQPVNSAKAIWTRNKSDITEDQYAAFYRSISFGFDAPLTTTHIHAEGTLQYKALLFVPTMRPYDLYDPSRKQALKLYVRRVFISDNIEGLTYPWLRFLRGVVDSDDLPLNISRETLQYNPVLAKIRTHITKKILGDLIKLSKDDEAKYMTFWGQFGAVLKEGLYDAVTHRDDIFTLCRFASTRAQTGEKMVSLDDYIENMVDGQKEIYYITGENANALRNSPQVEGFKSRGIEVLCFTDTIDDFWLQQVDAYKGYTFKSVTKGDIDLDTLGDSTPTPDADTDEQGDLDTNLKHVKLIDEIGKILGAEVDGVRISKRLTDSPVCLVAPEGGVDMHMERVLKLQQNYDSQTKPVLEVNKDHPLIQKIADIDVDSDSFKDAAYLLLDQARIIQGQPVSDPAAFARRMAQMMERGL